MGPRYEKDRLINLHYGDMTDSSSLIRVIQMVQPDEIYNLAAQSHVKVSFDVPEYTAESDAVGTLRMLEAVRILGLEKKTKIYQASTSELFGKVQEIPQKKQLHFILVAHMVLQNNMVFGLPKIIVKVMVCLLLMASFSTMKVNDEERHL